LPQPIQGFHAARSRRRGGVPKPGASDELLISDCTFLNNSCKDGGAVYNKGILAVKDSTFDGNHAERHGAAIRTSGGSLILIGNSFTGNTWASGMNGGAVYFTGDGAYIDEGGNTASDNVGGSYECNGSYDGTCTIFIGNEAGPIDPSIDAYDAFGVSMLYGSVDQASRTSFAPSDWISGWQDYIEPLNLDGSGDVDSQDMNNAEMRSSGSVTSAVGSPVATLSGSPRLYIRDLTDGWENVEFTFYANFMADLRDPQVSYAGFTMGTRSGHYTRPDPKCDGTTYFAKIYRLTGEVGFQKEYFDGGTGQKVYSSSSRQSYFDTTMPLDTWIGMKFVLYTMTSGSVKLEIYVDETDGLNGGEWYLAHQLEDAPNNWPVSSSYDPTLLTTNNCTVQDGDPILGSMPDSFIRIDYSTIEFKSASIRRIDGTPL